MKDCSKCPYVQAQRENGQRAEHAFRGAMSVLSDMVNSNDPALHPFLDAIEQHGFVKAMEQYDYSDASENTGPLPFNDPDFQRTYEQLQSSLAYQEILRERATRAAQETCREPEPDPFLLAMGAVVLHCTATDRADIW